MRIFKIVAAGCFLLVGAVADTWDKKTVLTLNEPLLLPGTTLQPGKYVLKLVDSQSNRHIVRVMNEREDQIFTTILAIPNWRLKPTGTSQFMFWETPAGNPKALRAWFYPGDNFGQEFAYPKGLAAKIAKEFMEDVPAYPEITTEAELAIAPVETVIKPGPEPVQIAQAPPAPTPTVETVAPPAALPTEIPRTGSLAPLIFLGGLATISAGLVLRGSLRR